MPDRMPWADTRPSALRSAVSHLADVRNRARDYGDGRDWETPIEIFRPLDDEFDFTLDPCCTDETAKTATHFT